MFFFLENFFFHDFFKNKVKNSFLLKYTSFLIYCMFLTVILINSLQPCWIKVSQRPCTFEG